MHMMIHYMIHSLYPSIHYIRVCYKQVSVQ